MGKHKTLTRRELLRTSAATAGAMALSGAGARLAWARGSDAIRVGVVGCGKRGAAAAQACIKASPGVTIAALADAFQDPLDALKQAFQIAAGRCFLGLDAYRKLMALDDVDLVILATPPAFRPVQFAEAVKRGKHVFMEAPVAVCPAGVKMVVEASKTAAGKKLAVVAGTQRRHQPAVVETMKRIRDGAIGTIVAAQCYWNQGALPVYKRRPGQSDVEWQIRNWPYFRWLSGDHIVTQHVHNIDVVNWAFNTLPDAVHSVGGRQSRTGPQYGNTYDHFGSEFFYPGDVRTISMCRQIDGTDERIDERVAGTKGSSDCCGTIEGEKPWKYEGPNPDPTAQVHADLIKSIRDGKPLNEGQTIADSTLCAIMARESAYTRQRLGRAAFLSKCTLSLLPPEGLSLSAAKPVAPLAVPGKYQIPGAPAGGGRRRRRKK